MNCESFELFSQTSFNYSFFSKYKQHMESGIIYDSSHICVCAAVTFL